MDDLIEIYRRIEYLRNNGLKMKEIADFIDMAPVYCLRFIPVFCPLM